MSVYYQPPSSNLDETDPTFVEDLKESDRAVRHVADWLRRQGLKIDVRPLRIRPSADERGEYADQGDLWLIQRIEVKRRLDLHFARPEDFPYPTLIVDVAHAWDRADPKPWLYVILNAELSACFLIRGSTSDQWLRVTRFDPHIGRAREYVECPVELAEFREIE